MADRSVEGQLGAQWTPVDNAISGVEESKTDLNPFLPSTGIGVHQEPERESRQGIMNDCMAEYLTMLQRSRGANSSSSSGRPSDSDSTMAIEGSLKLAQHVKFPDQRVSGTSEVSIPAWYTSLRDSISSDPHSSETSAIRSVSSLSQGKSVPSFVHKLQFVPSLLTPYSVAKCTGSR